MSTGTIVCAVNETTGAAEALRAAARLSDRVGMRLVAVNVIEEVPLSPPARREARAGGLPRRSAVTRQDAAPSAAWPVAPTRL